MTATYDPIATTTLGSAASTITFSSIPNTFTDLRLVFVATSTTNTDFYLAFNSDNSGSNYSSTWIRGNGSAASSSRNSNQPNIILTQAWPIVTSNPQLRTIDVFSYAGSTNKTCLITENSDLNGSGGVANYVGLWRNTSAINRIDFTMISGSFAAGTTATLYGIKAE